MCLNLSCSLLGVRWVAFRHCFFDWFSGPFCLLWYSPASLVLFRVSYMSVQLSLLSSFIFLSFFRLYSLYPSVLKIAKSFSGSSTSVDHLKWIFHFSYCTCQPQTLYLALLYNLSLFIVILSLMWHFHDTLLSFYDCGFLCSLDLFITATLNYLSNLTSGCKHRQFLLLIHTFLFFARIIIFFLSNCLKHWSSSGYWSIPPLPGFAASVSLFSC